MIASPQFRYIDNASAPSLPVFQKSPLPNRPVAGSLIAGGTPNSSYTDFKAPNTRLGEAGMCAFAFAGTVVRRTPWLSAATTRSVGGAIPESGDDPDEAHDDTRASTRRDSRERIAIARQKSSERYRPRGPACQTSRAERDTIR